MEDNILKELFGNNEGQLSEEAQKTITEAFQNRVNTLVKEKVDLALEQQDKEHTKCLQQIVEKYENKIKTTEETLKESIDIDHTEKAKQAFRQLDENYADRLEEVRDLYEEKLGSGMETFTSGIVKAIDLFLEDWVDTHVPTDMLKEAAKKDYSQELLGKVKRLVSLDESVNEDIRDAMKDANSKIIALESKLEKVEAEKVLSEKTATLPTLVKNFVVEAFEGKDADYINRNFEFLVEQYDKHATRLTEQTSASNVDQTSTILEESKKVVIGEEEAKLQPNNAMALWVNSIQGGDSLWNS